MFAETYSIKYIPFVISNIAFLTFIFMIPIHIIVFVIVKGREYVFRKRILSIYFKTTNTEQSLKQWKSCKTFFSSNNTLGIYLSFCRDMGHTFTQLIQRQTNKSLRIVFRLCINVKSLF
jgi:hypothetical protein